MHVSKPTSILIVEDDLDLLDTLKNFFDSEFKKVYTAVDGISAYLCITQDKPDIVFSDLKMPGMTGLDFLHQLRAEGNNTPVVLASAMASREDIINGLKLNISDFVDKPYTLEGAKQALYRTLEINRRKKEVAELELNHGNEGVLISRHKKIIGLFQAVSCLKKSS